jgi:protein phosphatase 1 regulatory subunit 11
MSSHATTASSSPRQAATNANRDSSISGAGRRLAHGHLPSRRPAAGSLTQTMTPEDTASSRSISPEPVVLRLRGAHDASGSRTDTRRRIQWAEDVIDNEGLGRKSSKVCCIYHKQRAFGESSSEEDSSSDDSSSDSDAGGSDSQDDGGARMSGNRTGKKSSRGRPHSHPHGEECGHGKGKAKRKPSPNAYERMPKHNTRPAGTKS